MKYYFKLLILIALIGLNACLSQHSLEEKPIIYYDLNGFLQKQIDYLEAQKPMVKKKVHSDTKIESKTLQIDNWQKELKMFQEVDINKPIYKDLYEVKEENLANGNILITYQAKKSDLKTQMLAVEHQADKKTLVKIKAKYLDYNFLYKSEKELTLEKATSSKVINQYYIHGYHNNLFGSKIKYSIESEVLLKP